MVFRKLSIYLSKKKRGSKFTNSKSFEVFHFLQNGTLGRKKVYYIRSVRGYCEKLYIPLSVGYFIITPSNKYETLFYYIYILPHGDPTNCFTVLQWPLLFNCEEIKIKRK